MSEKREQIKEIVAGVNSDILFNQKQYNFARCIKPYASFASEMKGVKPIPDDMQANGAEEKKVLVRATFKAYVPPIAEISNDVTLKSSKEQTF